MHHGVAPAEGEELNWRRPLVNRTTDLACIEYTRKHPGGAVRPLSVSADLLGHTAMRSAALLARLDDAGIPVDRSGTTGRIAEVYPAACLALWEVRPRRYKGRNREQLGAVVDDLTRKCSRWLDVSAAEEAMRTSDHVFDAVVAALAARAVVIGKATAPETVNELDRARREGWIRLPKCTLSELVYYDDDDV